jgi:replication factor A1
LYVTAAHTHRLIIILALEIVPWNGEKIGNPVTLDGASPPAVAAPAAAPAPVAAAAPTRGTASNNRQPAARPARPAGDKNMGPIFPIEGLSPYQNK